MLGARLSRSEYKKEYFILLNGSHVNSMRFGHNRPDSAYIFEINNSNRLYSNKEIEEYRRIYFNEILNYMGRRYKITYQDKNIEDIFKLEK